VLWNQTSQTVDDRAVTDLFVVLSTWGVPLIAVDFHESFHKQLRPQLIVIQRPSEDGLLAHVARHTVIDLDQAFFAVKP
jgi:hypothetical protein